MCFRGVRFDFPVSPSLVPRPFVIYLCPMCHPSYDGMFTSTMPYPELFHLFFCGRTVSDRYNGSLVVVSSRSK